MSRQHISELRKLRKLSQAALGKEAGLTASEISRIECGYRDMSEAEAVSIAKALGVLPAKVDPRLLRVIQPSGIAASEAVPAVPAPAASPNPGYLENDPSHFREMPDYGVFESGGLSAAERRLQWGELLRRATRILHTPKVPAATWRAWREFERKLQEHLRQ